MEFLQNIGLFFTQALIIVLSIIAIILTLAAVALKNRKTKKFDVEILNDTYRDQTFEMKTSLLKNDDLKTEKKNHKKDLKFKQKNNLPQAYVLNFLHGDVKASGVEQLREEITNLLLIAKKGEEVIIKVESPGGIVHGYGLAAAQILRLRDFGLKVTICVDKIAASGGYMMACTAHEIVCAPFAIIGSIGVVAQVPNFYRLLKKNDVDYKEYTAGDYKRTVSIFGEITEKGEKKFNDQLESTHLLFKNFVNRFRPQVNLSEVTTGEYWFGEDALKLKLVDHLGTSDDYILNKMKTHTVIQMALEKKTSLSEKFSDIISKTLMLLLEKFAERAVNLGYQKNNITEL